MTIGGGAGCPPPLPLPPRGEGFLARCASTRPAKGGLRGYWVPGEVAGGQVALGLELEWGFDLRADLLGDWAAGAEAAAGRRVDRARHVAREHDPGPLAPGHRLRDGREQRDRV